MPDNQKVSRRTLIQSIGVVPAMLPFALRQPCAAQSGGNPYSSATWNGVMNAAASLQMMATQVDYQSGWHKIGLLPGHLSAFINAIQSLDGDLSRLGIYNQTWTADPDISNPKYISGDYMSYVGCAANLPLQKNYFQVVPMCQACDQMGVTVANPGTNGGALRTQLQSAISNLSLYLQNDYYTRHHMKQPHFELVSTAAHVVNVGYAYTQETILAAIGAGLAKAGADAFNYAGGIATIEAGYTGTVASAVALGMVWGRGNFVRCRSGYSRVLCIPSLHSKDKPNNNTL